MDRSADFWNRIAEKYAKDPIADEASYRKKLKKTQEYFRPEMNVLEIGCGTGSTATIHAPFVQHIRATDISSEMLRIAKEKADAAGIHNITFECTSVDKLKVLDESVDMVMARSILHLLEDWDEVIGRIFDMLKPGGLFVSSTICMNDGLWFLRPVLPLMYLFGRAPKVVRAFTTNQLLKSIRDAGFEIEYQWQPGRMKATFIVAKKPE